MVSVGLTLVDHALLTRHVFDEEPSYDFITLYDHLVKSGVLYPDEEQELKGGKVSCPKSSQVPTQEPHSKACVCIFQLPSGSAA